MFARLIALASLAGVLPAALAAQVVQASALQPGARVRLAAGCVAQSFPPGRQPSPTRRELPERCTQYDGALVRVSNDSVAIVADGREVAIARSDIRWMRLRTGTRGNWVPGAAIGAGVGLAAGLVSSAAQDCSGQFLQDLCTASQMMAPFVAGAIGAGVGALIGGLVRSDRWDTVSLRMTAALPQGQPTLRLGLAIAF
jgi:hypothetical protein